MGLLQMIHLLFGYFQGALAVSFRELIQNFWANKLLKGIPNFVAWISWESLGSIDSEWQILPISFLKQVLREICMS